MKDLSLVVSDNEKIISFICVSQCKTIDPVAGPIFNDLNKIIEI